jgi:fucose permease
MTQAPDASAKRSFAALPLYLAFAGTGIGVALPGALLPTLVTRWHLTDEQAGRLFLAAWLGSSVGALLVGRALRTHLMTGCAAISLAAIAIGATGGPGADLAFALFGFGLGMVMTSISLIREQQSRRARDGKPGDSGTEMVRLNLFWALGAFACPTLALHALAAGTVRPLLFGIALGFAGMAAWTALQTKLPVRRASTNESPSRFLHTTPPGLVAMICLITGIEASAGGWLATLAHRGEHTVDATVAAPTLFWAGLLLSRAFWSGFSNWLTHDKVVRVNIALMAVCSTLMVVARNEGTLLATAWLLGFGIGPTYPLLLAWALRLYRGGAIFFLAGVGSALLPWLTGLVSTRAHSLRVGFSVPMLGTLILFTLASLLPLASWSRRQEAGQL